MSNPHAPRLVPRLAQYEIGNDVDEYPDEGNDRDFTDRKPFATHDEDDECHKKRHKESPIANDFEHFVHDLFERFRRLRRAIARWLLIKEQ